MLPVINASLEKYPNAPHALSVLFTLASLRFFKTYLSSARLSHLKCN